MPKAAIPTKTKAEPKAKKPAVKAVVKVAKPEVEKKPAQGLHADLYNLKNEIVGKVDLPTTVFGVAWKPAVVQQVLVAQLANRRSPWAHVRDRSEVRGGGKKPWRQKGTGRARHGSTRSPLWSGGGKSHGPRNDKDYSQKVNVKVKRLALLSVLSKKFADQQVKFFDTLAISEPKTKAIASYLHSAGNLGKKFKNYDMLIVPEQGNANLFRAARNLPKVKVSDPASLNVYDMMNYKRVFIDQKALSVIAEHYKLIK